MICKKRIIKLFSSVLMLCGFVFGISSCTLGGEKEDLKPTITADGIDYCDGDVIDMPENVVFRYDGTDRASSLTLKATITPESAINKKLSWSLVWADGGSHGTTSNYVALIPSSDTLSCTVTCKKGFNYQLKVVVSSSINSNVNASCTLDYEKRIYYIDYDNKSFVYNYCEGGNCKLSYGGEDEDGFENFYVNLNDINYLVDCCPTDEVYLFDVWYQDFKYQGTVMSNTKKDFYVYGTFEWIEYYDGFDDIYELNGRFQCVNTLKVEDLYGITDDASFYQGCDEELFFSSLVNGMLKICYTIEDELGSSCSFNVFYYME